jgi:hypothetical protein
LHSAASGVITSTFAGTSTYALTSNGAGSAPTYQILPSAITGPGSSTDRAIATWNGTGATALYNNSTATIDSTGRMQNSAQPYFQAYLSANTGNVTGDGTVYTVAFNSTVANVGSSFNTGTYTFTAPVTGHYVFSGVIYWASSPTSATTFLSQLVTTTTTYNVYSLGSPNVTNGVTVNSFSVIVPMSASDTAKINVTGSGGTKNTVIGGTQGLSNFSGFLLFG